MRIFYLFLLLAFSMNAKASGFNSTCEKLNDSSHGYCIHKPANHASEDVVYYFHGNGGSEFTWQEESYYTHQVREEWDRKNLKVPTVVSVSFGESWLLAPKNHSPYSGLFEVMTERVIPLIERKLGGLKGRRIVVGESMGGFNAIQMALRTNLFDKAAVLCSPMATISPFASEEEIKAFIEKTEAWKYYRDLDPHMLMRNIRQVIWLAQGSYPNQQLWDQADPLNLAQNPSRISTEMYVAIGMYDWTAAYETNQIFVNHLVASGLAVEWRPQWGGHCAIDIPSLAEFLVH